MINQIYRLIAMFFIKAVAFIFCFIAAFMSIILFLQTNIFLFDAVFIGLIGLSLYFGVSLVWDYRKLTRFDWLKNESDTINAENLDEIFKICAYYVNGATYEKLKTDFNLSENNQVQRRIKEGIRELLKEHDVTKSS